MNSFVVVTGCAGFIGSHLTERLLREGQPVLGIDNFDRFYERSRKDDNLRFLQKIARDNNTAFEFLEADCAGLRNFRGKNVSNVFHFAGRGGVRPSLEQPEDYLRVNLAATLRLLEICREQNLKNFVFVSSSSVYGNDTPVPFSVEARADRPVSPYAASKRAAELYCSNYAHLYGMKVAMLRLFTVYGPRQRPDLAIYKFANLMLDGKSLPIYGDGTTSRDYTFVSDIVDGALRAGKFVESAPAGTAEVFNLGNSSPVELQEMVRLLEKHLGRKAEIQRLPPQPGDVERTCADISKSKAVLGYEPKVNLDEGIRLFTQWITGHRHI
jgi:UDP-glucuronate 4-epimerase